MYSSIWEIILQNFRPHRIIIRKPYFEFYRHITVPDQLHNTWEIRRPYLVPPRTTYPPPTPPPVIALAAPPSHPPKPPPPVLWGPLPPSPPPARGILHPSLTLKFKLQTEPKRRAKGDTQAEIKWKEGTNLVARERDYGEEIRANCPWQPRARTNELDSSYEILTISVELRASGSRDGRITHLRTQNAGRCVNYCERSRIPPITVGCDLYLFIMRHRRWMKLAGIRESLPLRVAGSRTVTGSDEATTCRDQCRPRNSFLALVRSEKKPADVRGISFDRGSLWVVKKKKISREFEVIPRFRRATRRYFEISLHFK